MLYYFSIKEVWCWSLSKKCMLIEIVLLFYASKMCCVDSLLRKCGIDPPEGGAMLIPVREEVLYWIPIKDRWSWSSSRRCVNSLSRRSRIHLCQGSTVLISIKEVLCWSLSCCCCPWQGGAVLTPFKRITYWSLSRWWSDFLVDVPIRRCC